MPRTYKPRIKEGIKEMGCPKDGRRCYIHYDSDGFEIKCRHGSCLVDSPCEDGFKAKEEQDPEQTLQDIEIMRFKEKQNG